MDDTVVVEIVDFNQPKLRNRVNLVTVIAAVLITMVSATILQLNGFASQSILIIVALFIPETLAHEYLHFFFQWHFSKEKPHLGFRFPFPYSALSGASSIARNQAVLTALAPALIITPILVIPALFTTFFFKMLLLAWAFLALASCYGDFYLAYRLLNSPRDSRLKQVNLANVIYRPKTR
jgi:hypothetical protein